MLIGGLQIRRPRDPMIATSLILVAAVLIVRLLVHEAAFHGPYPGQSVSNAPGP